MAHPTLHTDTLRRSSTADEQLRLVTVNCTAAVGEACSLAGLQGVDAIVLGRALIGGFLLSASAKRDAERLRIQIAGEGQVGQIMVDVHGDGRARAALQTSLPAEHPLHLLAHETPRPVLGPVVGLPGTLTVTRDLAMARQYQGHVDLVSAEIDEDLEAYLNDSEQVPSVLRAAVKMDDEGRVLVAAGVLAQTLPGADMKTIAACRERLAGGGLREAMGSSVTHEQLACVVLGVTLDDLRLGLSADLALRFHCPCGAEQARRVLSTLGADDLMELADEQAITDVRCNFCGRTTEVDASAIREIAATIRRRLN